jgi:hypothetical protein
MTLLLPLYVSVVFATNYIGALHSPRPHHVEVAVVGAPAATAPVTDELSTPKDAFRVSELRSVAQARRLVGERKVAGGSVASQLLPDF